jgi:WhiB family redox-sensing transcriptional regulator
VFFVDRGVSTKPAHQLCESCPVREPCAEAGLGEHFGIWGGRSEYERRRLRRTATAPLTMRPVITD